MAGIVAVLDALIASGGDIDTRFMEEFKPIALPVISFKKDTFTSCFDAMFNERDYHFKKYSDL
jgi:hypothetical protein